MILFIHRTLLGALDPIIGGFREGGLRGGLTSLAQVVLNPIERRESETTTRAVARRELRRIEPSGGSVSDVGGFAERQPAFPVQFTRAVRGGPIARAVGGIREGFTSTQQFDRTIRRTRIGAGIGAVAAGSAFKDFSGGIREAVAAAGRQFDPRRPAQFRQKPLLQALPGELNGGSMAQDTMPSAVSATGQMTTGRMSNFAKDEFGNVLKFFCSPRPGEGWIQVEDAASLGLRPMKPFSRLDLSIGQFVRMPRRRMNPLNMKALGRANRRREDFIDICATHLRERRREREGKKPSIKNTSHRKKKK